MTAPLWCEARCDGLYDPGVTGCHETAEGAFGPRAAAALARRHGWRVVRGEWLCPACQSRRAAATATTKDLTHDQDAPSDKAAPERDL